MRLPTLLLCLCCLLIVSNTHAQLVSGNAFLKGNYIRLGLAPNAAFGSTASVPSDYILPGSMPGSSGCNLNKMGFVADLGKNGWNVGTPAFIGDYFLPGAPEEGWGISMNGSSFNNNRNNTGLPSTGLAPCSEGTQIAGSFTSYQDLANEQVAIWEGSVNGLGIKKKITLPKDKLYFIIEITFTNNSAATVNNLYYMRNVDPDNEVASTGNFQTQNKIVFQNTAAASANKALVSATGITYGSYLGLGTIDCRARVCIRGNGLMNRDAVAVYNGLSPRQNAQGYTETFDSPIAISFGLGNLKPTESVSCAFAYILSEADLEEALGKTAPKFNVAGTSVRSGGAAINCTSGVLPISIEGGTDYTWKWSPATGLNTTSGPSVTYTTQPIPVTYTAVGISSICKNDTLTITIYPPTSSVANFNFTEACGSKIVNFTNKSITLPDPLATYDWDFGDGTPIDNTISPVHSFPAFDTFNVKLTVHSTMLTCGDTVITKQIILKDKPGATIAFDNKGACQDSTVQLTGTGTVTSGDPVNEYYWELAGGVTYTTPAMNHTFSTTGDKLIKFAVKTLEGCSSDTVLRTITIESNPVADFVSDSGCVAKSITFTSSATNAEGVITQYNWNLGNGSTNSSSVSTASYLTPGNKTVKLSVATGNGCAAMVEKIIDIESIPKASFDVSTTCLDIPIEFSNTSTTDYGSIVKYEWRFGDGSPVSNATDETHTYSIENNYMASLKAISSYGCESVLAIDTIKIKKVEANAGKDTLIFKNTTFGLRGKGGSNYTWVPAGLLNRNDIFNPSGTLDRDQVFTLTINTAEGCVGTDKVLVEIYKEDDVYVPNSFTPNRDGRNDVFRLTAPPIALEYFEVYNRWGEKIFSTKDQYKGWNGFWNGKEQPSGTYVWILKAKIRGIMPVERKGTVTIVR